MIDDVSVVACRSYERGDVDSAVARTFNLLGGVKSFIKEGDRVALKVNLLMPASPAKGVTTHPAFVGAVARQVQKVGGMPFIVDSPGAGIPYKERVLKLVYKKSGLMAVADEVGVELNYDTSVEVVHHPEGTLIKRFEVIKSVRNADVIVNLPKLKTHAFTTLTCAVKNLFGCLPGFVKPGYHSKLSNVEQFSQMLLDLNSLVSPTINIVDGVVGMEGEGPSQGELRDVGVIIAGADAVEVDLAACEVLGIPPATVPYLKIALDSGAGRPQLVGDKLDSLKISDLKLPTGELTGLMGLFARLPYISRLGRPLARELLTRQPVVISGACVGCGACERACPEGAINVVEGKAVIDYNKCIRCYCCHELCPHHTVKLRRSFFHLRA